VGNFQTYLKNFVNHYTNQSENFCKTEIDFRVVIGGKRAYPSMDDVDTTPVPPGM